MRKSKFRLVEIFGLRSLASRIGGNKLKIAEDAKQKAASYMSGKREVENLEKLAQVLPSRNIGELLLTCREEFENDSSKPERAMATVPTMYHRTRPSSVLLSPQRTRFSWSVACKS